MKYGSERCVSEARDHLVRIRTLTDFSHFDGHEDKGSGGLVNARSETVFHAPRAVREKARQLVELLTSSNDRIREERDKARQMRSKYVGISSFGGQGEANHALSATPF